MTNKIKVGDKVRIKSADFFHEHKYPDWFMRANSDVFGKEALVIFIRPRTDKESPDYMLDVDAAQMWWISDEIVRFDTLPFAYQIWLNVLLDSVSEAEIVKMFNMAAEFNDMGYLHIYDLDDLDEHIESKGLSPTEIIKSHKNVKIDWEDLYFTDVVNIETFNTLELHKHINFGIIYYDSLKIWKNIIGDEYSLALAEEIGLDFDRYGPYGRKWWEDFIQDKYDYVNIPDDVNQIRKDWEIWYDRSISDAC